MATDSAKLKKSITIYMIVIALVALANGLSNDVFSNYFKEVYNVTTFQRGAIELPRELPGMLIYIIISSLSLLGDLRISIISQFLCALGIIVLGLVTPVFGVMLIFLFINSLGMHLFMPLTDSIAMSLISGEDAGRKLGRFKGVSTAFTMCASLLIFVGFRTGLFSFSSNIKLFFIIAGIAALGATVFLIVLYKFVGKDSPKTDRKIKFVFRKEYKFYYIIAITWGVQKQIMAVFAPWVLIQLLFQKADSLAILGMAGAFAGIFFIPAVGRWIDRFGLKKMLYADAFSFIFVYLAYGIFSAGFHSGTFATTGLPVILIFALFIIDRMSMQMSIVRTLYLRAIAVSPQDITPTLSMGISLDHIVSISAAVLGGIVWDLWGPQYVFFLAASLSLANLVVAKLAVIPSPKKPIDLEKEITLEETMEIEAHD
jgi:predicted MFS family arabinose efflux permease